MNLIPILMKLLIFLIVSKIFAHSFFLMPRYYRRRYRTYRSGKSKYSNETTTFSHQNDYASTPLPAGTTFPVADGRVVGFTIVAPTQVYGTRKVKNFDVQITSGAFAGPMRCALVYVPQGTNPSSILSINDSATLYEPNQNVILSFIVPDSGNGGNNLIHFKSRLARNLDSGDSIVLICYNIVEQSGLVLFAGQVNFAIRY